MASSNSVRQGTGSNRIESNRIRAAEKRRRALDLRKAGSTFSEIASQVGYASSSGAHKAVKTALDAVVADAADEIRKLRVVRLEALLGAVWDVATQGQLGAVDRALKLLDRQAKLLGLDLPRRTEEQPDDLPAKVYINFPMDDI